MARWKAVVFDLDDTLYPERSFVLSGFRAAAQWAELYLAIPASEGITELARLYEDGVRGNTFDKWLGQRGCYSPQTVGELIKIYREHSPTLRPFPETKDMLQRLRARRHNIGLLSDGLLGVQRRKLSALHLVEYFDVVVLSDQFGREAWKPNPETFRRLLQILGLSGDECIYVGDNPLKDFVGAKQLGMFTMRVCHPEGIYRDVQPPTPAYAPDVTCFGLAEVEKAILSS
ncbi:HAD-IA family hydrolase [Nitrospiraceae bacterium AH_259_D15_M11_P09]|nr:HAD-IA family hydrolase [Nitrospiraceae bacterium AH_259_D15_M11_P09]